MLQTWWIQSCTRWTNQQTRWSFRHKKFRQIENRCRSLVFSGQHCMWINQSFDKQKLGNSAKSSIFLVFPVTHFFLHSTNFSDPQTSRKLQNWIEKKPKLLSGSAPFQLIRKPRSILDLFNSCRLVSESSAKVYLNLYANLREDDEE